MGNSQVFEEAILSLLEDGASPDNKELLTLAKSKFGEEFVKFMIEKHIEYLENRPMLRTLEGMPIGPFKCDLPGIRANMYKQADIALNESRLDY